MMPKPGTKRKKQINLTKSESRIMFLSSMAFNEARNAQEPVAVNCMLSVKNCIEQQHNDSVKLAPLLQGPYNILNCLGAVAHPLTDTRYSNQENVEQFEVRNAVPYTASGLQQCNAPPKEKSSNLEPLTASADPITEMKLWLKPIVRNVINARWKSTIEPVLVTMVAVMGSTGSSSSG